MGSVVVYTWTCDKCGAVVQNDGGLPRYWRYVGLTGWWQSERGDGRDDSSAFTQRFLVCDPCMNGSNSMNTKEAARKGLFHWLFDRRKP